MSWPLPDEINEAIQTPSLSFADPDLKGGQPVLGASGYPLPRSGNFADVYQVLGADGREWAVKCFTRPATGLDKRYDKVAACLAATPLPFAVEFTFLKDGLRIKNQWYPVVKMQWVEGLQLNQFVRENAARPVLLDSLLLMWTKLAYRLRDAGIAHADLQHGNVMLVTGAKPGSLGLKLLDYDGMYVPALANQPSGERGHSAFQHPERAAQNVYSPDLDRFPHLVVATALKGVAVLGKPLWDRYDTGDNLLFTEADFKNPAASKLLRELWQTGHPTVRALAGRLAIACRKPITQTPWLDQFAPDGVVAALSTDEEREATAALGLATAARPVVAAAPAKAAPFANRPRAELEFEDEEPDRRPTRSAPSRTPLLLALVAGIGLVGFAGVAAAVYFLAFPATDTITQGTTTQPTVAPPNDPPEPQPQPNTTPTQRSNDPPDTPRPTPKTPTPTPPNPPLAATPTYQKETVDANFAPVPADAKTIPISWSVAATTPRNAMASAAVFTANGKRVAVSRLTANAIVILDAATGDVIREIATPSAPMGLVALADGNIAAQLTGSNSTTVYNPDTGAEVRKVPTANYDYYPNETYLMAGDRYVGSANGQYFGGWRPVSAPTNTPTASQEPGVLTVYSTETGKSVLDTLTGRGKLAFDLEGKRLLLVESQGRLRWYDIANKSSREVKFTDEKTGWVRALAPDASRVLFVGTLTGSTNRNLYVLDTTTGRPFLTLPREYLAIAPGYSALSVGGAVIALPGPIRPDRRSQLDLLDGRTGKLIGVIPLNETFADIQSMTFSPDGRRLLVARGNRGRFQVINLPSEMVAVTPKTPTPPDPKLPSPAGTKLAIPAEAAVTQAEADLRELYKAEFAKKTASDKKDLARQLLDLADKTPDDPTARYVMLRLGRDLATEAFDGTLAVRAIEALGRFYDVPAADQKAAALEKILTGTQQQAALRELAELALTTADGLIAQDGFDAAVRVTQVAATAARRGVIGNSDEFEARVAAVKKLRDAFAGEVKGALATLATKPDDPAAHQIVGKFRCYQQGRWEDGVKHLAKSDSLLLKTAADAELAADAATSGKPGDAWWEVAHVATDPVEKKKADARARMWYLRALPRLTGLPLARAQTRLTVTVGNVTYAPGLLAVFSSTSDIFKGDKGRIDTAIAFDAEEFLPKEGGPVPSIAIQWSGVVIPPKPGKYRIIVQIESASGDQATVTLNKTLLISTVKKSKAATKYEAVVTLPDRPTPLIVTLTTIPIQRHGLKVTWVPITSLGDGEETSFSDSLFHDKKTESVLK